MLCQECFLPRKLFCGKRTLDVVAKIECEPQWRLNLDYGFISMNLVVFDAEMEFWSRCYSRLAYLVLQIKLAW